MAAKSGFKDDDIQAMYETTHHRCAECGKEEPTSKKFPMCSKCKLIFYCGPECQRTNWKVHKKICSKSKASLSPEDQLQYFKEKFEPLLMTMTMWSMYRYYGNDCGRSHWRGNTHIVLAKLSDTPPGSPAAFQINVIAVDEIRNREDFIQDRVYRTRLKMEKELGPDDGIGALLLMYSYGKYKEQPLAELVCFMLDGAFSAKNVKEDLAQLSEADQCEFCDLQADALMMQINAMATGQAQSSMEAAERGWVS